MQKLWAKCFHSWVNTLRKYKMDYVWHRHTWRELHKIPYHTCHLCQLTAVICPSANAKEWDQSRHILHISRVRPLVFVFESRCGTPGFLSYLCHKGAIFPFHLPVRSSVFHKSPPILALPKCRNITFILLIQKDLYKDWLYKKSTTFAPDIMPWSMRVHTVQQQTFCWVFTLIWRTFISSCFLTCLWNIDF